MENMMRVWLVTVDLFFCWVCFANYLKKLCTTVCINIRNILICCINISLVFEKMVVPI